MPAIDVQGHRGCRGLLPENSIAAMIHALDLGVHTLEMDVVMTQDRIVVVSHDPWLSHELHTSITDGYMTEEEGKAQSIYKMTFDELQKRPYGSLAMERFPDQKQIAVLKPSLSQLISTCEAQARQSDRPLPYYNIEIKYVHEHEGTYHPGIREFTDAVVSVLDSLDVLERVSLQCFEPDLLRYLYSTRPDIRQAYLVEETRGHSHYLEHLGHTPAIYSPYFMFVTDEMIRYCHDRDIQVIPWTINDRKDILHMIALGVDGIISDYPDRVLHIIAEKNKN